MFNGNKVKTLEYKVARLERAVDQLRSQVLNKEPDFDRRKTGQTQKRRKNRSLAAKRAWETRRKNQENFDGR